MPEKKQLGEILILGRLITADQLEEALKEHQLRHKPLGETLVDLQFIHPDQLSRALSMQLKGEIPDASAPPPSPAARPATWLLRRRIPIKSKAAAIISLIILGMVLPISFLILRRQSLQSERRMMAFGTTLANTYANYSAEFVLQEDWPSLDPFIREIGKLEEVRFMLILDKEGTIKAHSNVAQMEKGYRRPERFQTVIAGEKGLTVIRYRDAGDSILDFSQPITYRGMTIGTIHLGMSERSMVKDARALRLFIILVTALAVVVGLLIALGTGALISKPIASLVRGTKEIGSGHFDYRITPTTNDELGDLSLAFNEMADGLKKKELIQATFGRYVTPEIVDLILSNPQEVWLKGARKMVTVLFADIRDFTGFAEDRQPEEVVTVLNQFFSMATEAILLEGGYINKFNGDQIMAVFGAPIYRDDHAQKAVRTAVNLQKAMEAWNAARRGEEKPEILAGIGINSGPVVAGNLGSQQKMEYTVIGDDVNLAARLTEIAGPGEVIISERTGELVRDTADLKALETIKVKGKKHQVMIYRVEGLKHARV